MAYIVMVHIVMAVTQGFEFCYLHGLSRVMVHIVMAVAQSIEFCHRLSIAHRDIKLENYVFLDSRFIEDGGVACLRMFLYTCRP